MRDHNGLYQAIVVSSADPLGQRRIKARVPDVLGTTISEWARPASIVDSPLAPGEVVWFHFPNGDYRWPTYHVPNDPAHGRIIPTPSYLATNGPLAAGWVLNSDCHAKRDDGGYVAVYATDFIKVSSAAHKTDIGDLDFDPVQAVLDAPAYSFVYQATGQPAVGPMRHDLPEVAQIGVDHVSEGTLVGILWEAVRRLSQRVAELEQNAATPISGAIPNTLGKVE